MSVRRLVLVHAHPDDESITTGVTMAWYAAQGVSVTLVTCTRGERGEVIPPELAHLASDGDALGAVREQELAAAMVALGVGDHRFLDQLDGAGRRYVDSGMQFAPDGSIVVPDEVPPDAFALADLDDTAMLLAGLLTDLRPEAVVTYDPGGGYGHPDHVAAHRVTMRAVELAAVSGCASRVFWVVLPESIARQRLARLATAPDNPFAPVPDGPAPSMVVPDDEAQLAIDGSTEGGRFVTAKSAALRAHRTQIEVAEPYFALSNGIGQLIGEVEYFRQVAGPRSRVLLGSVSQTVLNPATSGEPDDAA